MSNRRMTKRPESTTGIGFKNEDSLDNGTVIGPIFYITPDGLVPVGTDVLDGERFPIWDSRPNAIKQAKTLDLRFEEV